MWCLIFSSVLPILTTILLVGRGSSHPPTHPPTYLFFRAVFGQS